MVEQYDMNIIIVSAVILALSLLSPLVNIFFRSRKLNLTEEEEESETVTGEQATAPPPLSVIITPHDNARDLEQNLPLILEQDYPAA